MRLFIISFIIIPLLMISCNRMSEDELYQAAQTAYGQGNYQQSAEHYEQLIDRFPQGKYTEESLFLLANMYGERLENYRQAIVTHEKLRKLFPHGEKAPAALFLVGFIYNNQLHRLDSARIAYEQFLNEYPNNEMAASAKFELENLGKNPEELFKTQVAEKEEPAKSTPKKQTKKK